MSSLSSTLQHFFTTYLVGQRGASAHTVAAYRDTWRMLLIYVHTQRGIRPADVELTDLGAETITGFLQHLQTVRGNSTRTRNARLAAIHAFFSYASYRHPEQLELIGRVLAIQTKKATRAVLTYLTDDEVRALLDAPDLATRTGRRDYAIMATLIATGLRVGELTALRHQDVKATKPAHLIVHGKGRKDRITPLDPATATTLDRWQSEHPHAAESAPLFSPQGSNKAISTDAIAARIAIHARTAAATSPSLATKKTTPHTLRHTCAMRMLTAGIDLTTIALWLGHESTESTQAYLHADLGLKQRALDRLTPQTTKPAGRYVADDQMLAFLETL